MKNMMFAAALAAAVFVSGCATTATRSVDVSWNDRDYDDVTMDITRKVLHHVAGKSKDRGRLPVIANGPIIRTDHALNDIDRELLLELIRAEVMRSGYAEFSFATSEFRRGGDSGMLFKLLEAQVDSDVFNPDTVKSYGKMTAADYILFGKIFLPEGTRTWRISFSVIDVETGKGKWSDSTRIAK